MRAAAQYGGAKDWIEPIYEQAVDLVYRLEFGLLDSSDVEPPWDDLLIAAKCGLEGRKADHAKGSKSKGVATPLASQSERRQAIDAARRAMALKGG